MWGSVNLQLVLIVIFLIWSAPLQIYRTKFRKIVYREESWVIAVKPWFWQEAKALFGNIYPQDKEYLRMRNFYRFYLVVYSFLLVGIFWI